MRADDGWLSTLFDHERWDLPGREDDVQRILEQVRLRRRRRLLLRGLAGVAAAGLIAVAAIAVLSDPKGPQDTVANPGPLAEPVLSGPLPEPDAIRISGIEELPALLPGTKVSEWDVSRWSEPLAVDESGRVYVQLDDELHELTPSSSGAWSTSQPLAELELSEVIRVAADNQSVVWTEVTEDNREEDVLTVTRCLDRKTGEVHSLALPSSLEQRHFGDGSAPAYSTIPFGLQTASGLIVIEMIGATISSPRSAAQVVDVYTAEGCGASLEFGGEAVSPQVVGEWLYLMSGSTLWRSHLHTRGRSEPVTTDVADGGVLTLFRASDDAIVWATPKSSTSHEVLLTAARPDGSHPRALPADLGMHFPWAAGDHMVAGSIWQLGRDGRADTYEPVSRGLWMYFPSWGAIVTIDTPPAVPGQELHAIPAASGDYLLFTERLSPGGDVERAFVVELP